MKICEMLFKNWKWLFKNTNQTPPKILVKRKKKEKKRRENELKNSGEEREKKKGPKVQLTLTSGSLHMCLITKMPLKTENTSNVYSIFKTHNSKIRELSDGNKNWKQSYENPNRLLSYGSHHFWVRSDGNRVMSYENHKSKQPLSSLTESRIGHPSS